MRCEHISRDQQCRETALEGTSFCTKHSKNPQAALRRQYMLNQAKYRQRYSEFAESNELRSLNDEISIMRMVLEERLNMVTNDSEMLASCGQIASLAVVIERLVKSCHQLESRLGALLSKPSLLGIANEIVQILLKELAHIPGYEDLVDRISERIVQIITDAK
jgi:hypothetical protein